MDENFLLRILDHAGEQPACLGFANDGSIFELLLSPDGDWTIIRTTPNGVSCAAATGTHWQPHTNKGEPS